MTSVSLSLRFTVIASSLLWVGCSKPVTRSSNEGGPEEEVTHPDAKEVQQADPADRFEQAVLEEERRRKALEAFGEIETKKLSAERKLEIGRIKRIRNGVVGRTFQSLTISGTTLRGATVESIDDREIRLSHSGGKAHIPWDRVRRKVKEKWGYDEVAYKEIIVNEKLAIAEREALLNSPEAIAAKQKILEKRRQEESLRLQQEKRVITERIREMKELVAKSHQEIRDLKSQQRELELTFRDQDSNAYRIKASRNDQISGNDTIGGVKTSKADRTRAMEKIETKISFAESALERLKDRIKAEETRLQSIGT